MLAAPVAAVKGRIATRRPGTIRLLGGLLVLTILAQFGAPRRHLATASSLLLPLNWNVWVDSSSGFLGGERALHPQAPVEGSPGARGSVAASADCKGVSWLLSASAAAFCKLGPGFRIAIFEDNPMHTEVMGFIIDYAHRRNFSLKIFAADTTSYRSFIPLYDELYGFIPRARPRHWPDEEPSFNVTVFITAKPWRSNRGGNKRKELFPRAVRAVQMAHPERMVYILHHVDRARDGLEPDMRRVISLTPLVSSPYLTPSFRQGDWTLGPRLGLAQRDRALCMIGSGSRRRYNITDIDSFFDRQATMLQPADGGGETTRKRRRRQASNVAAAAVDVTTSTVPIFVAADSALLRENATGLIPAPFTLGAEGLPGWGWGLQTAAAATSAQSALTKARPAVVEGAVSANEDDAGDVGGAQRPLAAAAAAVAVAAPAVRGDVQVDEDHDQRVNRPSPQRRRRREVQRGREPRVQPEEADDDEAPRGKRVQREEADDDEAPRGKRVQREDSEGDDEAPRGRRLLQFTSGAPQKHKQLPLQKPNYRRSGRRSREKRQNAMPALAPKLLVVNGSVWDTNKLCWWWPEVAPLSPAARNPASATRSLPYRRYRFVGDGNGLMTRERSTARRSPSVFSPIRALLLPVVDESERPTGAPELDAATAAAGVSRYLELPPVANDARPVSPLTAHLYNFDSTHVFDAVRRCAFLLVHPLPTARDITSRMTGALPTALAARTPLLAPRAFTDIYGVTAGSLTFESSLSEVDEVLRDMTPAQYEGILNRLDAARAEIERKADALLDALFMDPTYTGIDSLGGGWDLTVVSGGASEALVRASRIVHNVTVLQRPDAPDPPADLR